MKMSKSSAREPPRMLRAATPRTWEAKMESNQDKQLVAVGVLDVHSFLTCSHMFQIQLKSGDGTQTAQATLRKLDLQQKDKDQTFELEVGIKIRDLPRRDFFSKRNPIAVLFKRTKLQPNFRNEDQTESLQSVDDADFLTHLVIPFSADPNREQWELRIYDRDEHAKHPNRFSNPETQDVGPQDEHGVLIGAVSVSLEALKNGDAAVESLKDESGRRVGGQVVMQIVPKTPASAIAKPIAAKVPDEVKDGNKHVELTVSCKNLFSMYTGLHRLDTIVVLEKVDPATKCWVYHDRTERIKDDINPTFHRKISLNCKTTDKLRLSVFDTDLDKPRERDRLGSAVFTMKDIVGSYSSKGTQKFGQLSYESAVRQRILKEKGAMISVVAQETPAIVSKPRSLTGLTKAHQDKFRLAFPAFRDRQHLVPIDLSFNVRDLAQVVQGHQTYIFVACFLFNADNVQEYIGQTEIKPCQQNITFSKTVHIRSDLNQTLMFQVYQPSSSREFAVLFGEELMGTTYASAATLLAGAVNGVNEHQGFLSHSSNEKLDMSLDKQRSRLVIRAKQYADPGPVDFARPINRLRLHLNVGCRNMPERVPKSGPTKDFIVVTGAGYKPANGVYNRLDTDYDGYPLYRLDNGWKEGRKDVEEIQIWRSRGSWKMGRRMDYYYTSSDTAPTGHWSMPTVCANKKTEKPAPTISKSSNLSHLNVVVLQHMQKDTVVSPGFTEQVSGDRRKNPDFGTALQLVTYPTQALTFLIYDSPDLHEWSESHLLGSVQVSTSELLQNANPQATFPVKFSPAAVKINSELSRTLSKLVVSITPLEVEYPTKEFDSVLSKQLVQKSSAVWANLRFNISNLQALFPMSSPSLQLSSLDYRTQDMEVFETLPVDDFGGVSKVVALESGKSEGVRLDVLNEVLDPETSEKEKLGSVLIHVDDLVRNPTARIALRHENKTIDRKLKRSAVSVLVDTTILELHTSLLYQVQIIVSCNNLVSFSSALVHPVVLACTVNPDGSYHVHSETEMLWRNDVNPKFSQAITIKGPVHREFVFLVYNSDRTQKKDDDQLGYACLNIADILAGANQQDSEKRIRCRLKHNNPQFDSALQANKAELVLLPRAFAEAVRETNKNSRGKSGSEKTKPYHRGKKRNVRLVVTLKKLISLDWFSKCDPLVVAYTRVPNDTKIRFLDKTEVAEDKVDHTFEKVLDITAFENEELVFGVFDVDHTKKGVSEGDQVGGVTVSMSKLLKDIANSSGEAMYPLKHPERSLAYKLAKKGSQLVLKKTDGISEHDHVV
mmetsp:Transcript_3672/g.6963  ORF Transcript_3672/g.6963 Transcript_3672/m.6963 type:complete len:1284 (-) Transcript_3672:131-3982(-)